MTSTKQITLSQLLGAVEQTFEEIFSGNIFCVIAETGDIKNYPDRQYCFFSLIEKQNGETLAKADAVIWRSHYHIISKFERITGKRFEKNIQVLLHIEVTYHAVYGLRLRVVDIDEKYTLGQIEQERQKVLENLVNNYPELVQLRQGEYHSMNKKCRLPLVMKNIALITAPDSDGLRDFMHELENNVYGYTFHVTQFLTRIQGVGAETDILNALKQVEKTAKKFDVVILVRGGGSGLDLGPFDKFEPGHCIAGFPIPVITGIGHERNISIADLMSHTRVKTPTKAASFIVEHNVSFEENILGISEEILENASRHIQQWERKLEKISANIFPSARHVLIVQRNKLDHFEAHAKLNDPQRILARGYSLIRKNDVLINHVEQLEIGDIVELQFASGKAGAQITQKS